MKQTIYYRESGYDKTIYNFFIIERETKAFVFLRWMNKLDKGTGVIAGEIDNNCDAVKLSKKKFNMMGVLLKFLFDKFCLLINFLHKKIL